jgi:hypothetical protein
MEKYTLLVLSVFTMIFVSCNNSGSGNATSSTDSNGASANNSSSAPAPFTKEVSYENYKFTVTTHGESNEHHFKLIPQGLTVSNDTLSEDVKGAIKDVIINDIDGDNSPEIGVIDVDPATQQGHIHVFTTFGGKSIGMTHMPDMDPGDPALVGYKGGDEYEFMENTLVRRFPIYEGDTKTGKMRQLQYKLKAGEAMKQLVVDKVTEF